MLLQRDSILPKLMCLAPVQRSHLILNSCLPFLLANCLRSLQDTALKSLQSTLHRLSEDQHASQSLVGSLSHQIDRISSAASSAGGAAPHSGAKSGSRSGSDGGDDSLQTDVQNLKSSVSALRGVAERTEELVLQVRVAAQRHGADRNLMHLSTCDRSPYSQSTVEPWGPTGLTNFGRPCMLTLHDQPM